MRASVQDVCLFTLPILCIFSTILIGISDAQVSVEASFDDPRCNGQMVCSNDPLVFTCNITGSTATLASVRLSGVEVSFRSDINTIVGEDTLPTGVTVQSFSATMDPLSDYLLTLAITEASILTGAVECNSNLGETDVAECQIATDPPGPPEGLSQDASANTETSAVVEWRSPATTGGSGITISEYTVTIDSQVSQTVSHDDSRDVFTVTIPVRQYNTTYSVSVTAINSCGLSSQPATTDVSIEARAPPQPDSVAISLECSETDARSVNISWTDGERDNEVVYPGEKAIVVLTPDNIRCSAITDTRCTATIPGDDMYRVNLTLTNDIGSANPVFVTFDSTALQTEDNLIGDQPSITVTVNMNCSISYTYVVTVSFGVALKGNSEMCNIGDLISETLVPGVPETFFVNTTKVPLMDNEMYCYDVTLQEATISPSLEPTAETGGLAGGAIAGIVVALVVVAIGLVVGFTAGFIYYNSRKRRESKDQEMKQLSPGSPVTKDTPAGAAVSSETGEVVYNEVSPGSRTAATDSGPLHQDPKAIEHQEGPGGDFYAIPHKSGKKGKKGKKGNEVEPAEQQEEAPVYSFPDKKGQKAKSEGLNYIDVDIQRSDKPAPPSASSHYADIKHSQD